MLPWNTAICAERTSGPLTRLSDFLRRQSMLETRRGKRECLRIKPACSPFSTQCLAALLTHHHWSCNDSKSIKSHVTPCKGSFGEIAESGQDKIKDMGGTLVERCNNFNEDPSTSKSSTSVISCLLLYGFYICSVVVVKRVTVEERQPRFQKKIIWK